MHGFQETFRARQHLANGETWVAGRSGLATVSAEDGTWQTTLDGTRVYDLEALPGGDVLAAADTGLWRITPDLQAERIGEGARFTVLAGDQHGHALLAHHRSGAWVSQDGGTRWDIWSMPRVMLPTQSRDRERERERDNDGKTSLHKIMKSLHTGKFLGDYHWIWGDLISLSFLLLVLSGLVTWWRSFRRTSVGPVE